MEELPLRFLKVSDTHDLLPGGETVRLKRAEFFLGPHGPFIERMPADDAFDVELQRRIALLRSKLQGFTL